MISIEKCNEILNKKEKKYNTEQIKEIRLTLYKIADIIYTQKNTHNAKLNREKSNSL